MAYTSSRSSSSSDNEIRVLKRDLELKDYKIKNLTNELEEVKKERDGIDSKPTPSVDVTNDVRSEQKAIWKSNSASFSEQGGSVGNHCEVCVNVQVTKARGISWNLEQSKSPNRLGRLYDGSRKPTIGYTDSRGAERSKFDAGNYMLLVQKLIDIAVDT
ncbi:hypothetical protein Tco_0216828 [Tanacetum coccineum]